MLRFHTNSVEPNRDGDDLWLTFTAPWMQYAWNDEYKYDIVARFSAEFRLYGWPEMSVSVCDERLYARLIAFAC